MPRILTLASVIALPSLIGDGELVAFDAGPDGVVYLVVALKPLDYTTENEVGVIFPKTMADQPQRYRVLGLLEGEAALDTTIEREPFNIHSVQPLGGDELLLTCGRSQFRGREDYDRNGRVYSCDGQFRREMLLGDGIRSVQTTAGGEIWTSYFDEGIGGNFGWKQPVGRPGLLAWDSAGNKLYGYLPPAGLEGMWDCYALNVASDADVWCYYYSQFPLVHLRNRKVKAYWEMPLSGSDAFAVFGANALFRGGYRERDTYHLFSLPHGEKLVPIQQYEFVGTDGQPLVAEWVTARSDAIHFIAAGFLYRVDVQTAISAQ